MNISSRSVRLLLPALSVPTFLVLAAFAATAPKGEFTPSTVSEAVPQQATDKDESSEWAQCQTYCSPTKPGTSVAEFRWRVSEQPLGVRELAKRKASELIQVSVYKDGFDRGSYAQIAPVGVARSFAMKSKRRTPGLSRLVLADVATTQQRNKRGFRMLDAADESGEWAVARIEGLEPGLVYFWRLQGNTAGATSDTVVRCQAATCPVDSGPRRR